MLGRNDGVENEKKIVDALNGKRYSELSMHQRDFLAQLNPQIREDTVIHAKKIGGWGYKPDVCIDAGAVSWRVSVKKGRGNSVHQEKTIAFLEYCQRILRMTKEEERSLLLFLYGDGTTDGSGAVESRKNEQELKSIYQRQIAIVQGFLDKHRKPLIERFLIYGRLGRQSGMKAEYLYHGDIETGVWCPLNGDAIDYLASLENTSGAPLSIGPMSLQVWNRNMMGKARMEDRRHSIQIKWSTCRQQIEEINQRYLKEKAKPQVDIIRAAGDNSQGFRNQAELQLSLDGQRIDRLSSPQKALMHVLFPEASGSLVVQTKSISEAGVKPKLAISAGEEVKNLSVFLGSGNAVHQEQLCTFLPYCREALHMTEEEEYAFGRVIYADGTPDGKGRIEDRSKDAASIKAAYPAEIQLVQDFLDRNKKALAERFLVYGKEGKDKGIKTDYLYYGTKTAGRCVPCSMVIQYILEQEKTPSAILAVGPLTIQIWNRNLTGRLKYENRRHSIQVKWGGMQTSLEEIWKEMNIGPSGTWEGSFGEFQLAAALNRNKQEGSRLWKPLKEKLKLEDLTHVYAVRVCRHVYSKLAEKNVLPKADVYLVRGFIPSQILLNNNYWLDEDTIKELYLEKIEGSGISCKLRDAEHYTYGKFSQNAFIRLFQDAALGAGISLFAEAGELHLNENVLKAWGIASEKFLKIWRERLEEEGFRQDDISLTNQKLCRFIKKECQREMADRIKTNQGIAEVIFQGKGVFEEPYTASFTYIQGKVQEAGIPQFSITTGSGRHKGKYTIVVKP